jgi:ACT domain-containing protein
MKKTDKAKEALLEQLRKTPILQIACEKLDINRTTLYRWRAESKEFATAIDEALLEGRLMVNDLAESQLIGAVKDRNITAILAWLKHNHPTYRARIEIEGSLKVIEELSVEQTEQVRRALALADVTLKSHE